MIAQTATWLSIASLVTSAVLSALAFRYSKQIERLKAELTEKIESQKVNWALTAKFSEIRFSRLHERQFDALQQAFTLLSNVNEEFVDILKKFQFATERSEAEKIVAARKAAHNLQNFMKSDGVLLPISLNTKIELVTNEIFSAWISISLQDLDRKMFFDASDSYFQKVPTLLSEIRSEIQRQLGVEP